MIDRILLKFFGWLDTISKGMDAMCNGIANLVIAKPKSKKRKCQKCHHKCHCKDELHADEYGLCTCDNCKCGA
jgi:hypothetical protein